MSSEIIKKTDSEITFLIKPTEAELAHAVESTFNHLRGRVKAPGFRPGKAPDAIVERELGTNTIHADVLDHAMQHAYQDVIKDQAVTVISQPEVTVKKFVPYTQLEFEAKIEVVPPAKLLDYTKLKKSMPTVTITSKQVDEVVEDLRRRMAERRSVNRGAKLDDEVVFDFDGKLDGAAVAGASSKNYTLKLGSNQFIPGFEPELVGLKGGDTKTFTITFPGDYHETALAGKLVEFTVTMNKVTELVLPPLDDKLAAQVGPFKTINELRADAEDHLRVEAEEAAKRQYENELLDEILAKSTLAAPERLAAQQLERLRTELSQRLAGSGMDMDKYLRAQNKTTDELDRELRPEADRRVRLAIMLNEVAKKENIQVSAEDVESELATLRQRYTDPTMQEELNNSRIKEDVYNHLLAARTVAKLTEYAQK